MTREIVYKILHRDAWRAAEAEGAFTGSSDDTRDGFVHLSTAAQLPVTAAKYFKHRRDLLLVAFDAATLGAALRWEPSRGGDLFPHLYAPLPVPAALWTKPLPLCEDGTPQLPDGLV